jgi:hypothetical protein
MGQYTHFTFKIKRFFNETKDCFIVRGCIVNLTEHKIKGEVSGKFEILGTYSAHLISAENQSKIKELMWSNPPVKEIYPYNRDLDLKIPIPTINSLNISKNKFTKNLISESNTEEDITLTLPDTLEKEVLGGNKVTYTGEANISSHIIETGLKIPTLIPNSLEEALNLSLFDHEFRPYLADIFLKKYPQVVSLHSLDAGDVSRTLGYTSLRLIPGENLPRHKRIYQLSPQDASYLEQLLEQFIRFNYVRRAPIESTDLHLYGMSTYLVHRKKLTDIAKLVIDFYPLTSIIQSPPTAPAPPPPAPLW